ncbi:MAG: DUF1573 domain-containing protein, partial [Phycisphaerales bacterium]
MRPTCSAQLCFVACYALAWLSGCQEKAQLDTQSAALAAEKKASDSYGAPKITFPKLGHDFGVVPPNKLQKADIKFTNTGQGTLKITKVSECCGVDTKLAGEKKLPAEYAPGESGAVHIEWRSGSQPMVFAREFIV